MCFTGLQDMGFILEPSSLAAAVSLSALSQAQPGPLAAADGLWASSTVKHHRAALFACSAGATSASLAGLVSASLQGMVLELSAMTPAGAISEPVSAAAADFMYRAELQAAAAAVAAPASGRARAVCAASLACSGRDAYTLRLAGSSVLGCMAQAVAALQQAVSHKGVQKVWPKSRSSCVFTHHTLQLRLGHTAQALCLAAKAVHDASRLAQLCRHGPSASIHAHVHCGPMTTALQSYHQPASLMQVHVRSYGAFPHHSPSSAASHTAQSALWAMLRVAASEAPGPAWLALDQSALAAEASGPAAEANLHGVLAEAGSVSVARMQRWQPPSSHHHAAFGVTGQVRFL